MSADQQLTEIRALLLTQSQQLETLRAELKDLKAGHDAATGPTVTIEEAQRLLSCSRTKVHALLAIGKLQRLRKVGRRTRITRESVESLQQAPTATKPTTRRPKTNGAQVEAEILKLLGR